MTHAVMDRLADEQVALGELLESRTSGKRDLSRYRTDLLGFARDILRVTLWSAQEQHLLAIQEHTRVAAYGANGCSKSFDDAIAALWWIFCWDGLAIATSAKESQLSDQFMRDVRRLFVGSTVLWGELRVLGLRRPDNPDAGLICVASGAEHNLRAYHAPRVMVQLHEAQGLPPFAFESAEIMAVGAEDRVTVSGNPAEPSGPFHRRCMSPHWHPVSFDARQHPNVLAGTVIIPGGPTRESLAQRARDYGEDSAFYRSSVCGEFPEQSSEALIRSGWLETAAQRWNATRKIDWTQPVVLGVDVAELGGDRTVVAVRCGRRLTHLVALPPSDTMATVQAVIRFGTELGLLLREQDRGAAQRAGTVTFGAAVATIRVDAIGVGAGVADRLHELGYRVDRFKGSNAPRFSTSTCLNARSEAFWTLRVLLERGELDLPDHEELRTELLAMTCRVNPTSGGIQMTDKDALRSANRGRSPDHADAVSMATYGMWQDQSRIWRTSPVTYGRV